MKFLSLAFLLLLFACSPSAPNLEEKQVEATVPPPPAPTTSPAPAAAPALEENNDLDEALSDLGTTPLTKDTLPEPMPTSADAPAIPSQAYLTGKFDPNKHPDFVKVAAKYTDGDPYVLHQDTYANFEAMHAAAKADGVQLVMVSATRNFRRQKQIWEAKWKGQRLLEGKEKANEVYPDPADRARAILRYSSMPGTSRHHWGTDIDLNALNNAHFKSGKGQKVYDWLVANAATYGFCQPYTPKGAERPQGYEEERWHWSYLPIATQLTDYAVSQMKDADIAGFAGAQAAPEIRVIENYVLGINTECL